MDKSTGKLYSDKFYNVKIIRTYLAYLKEKCLWPEDRIDLLLERCGCDITFWIRRTTGLINAWRIVFTRIFRKWQGIKKSLTR